MTDDTSDSDTSPPKPRVRKRSTRSATRPSDSAAASSRAVLSPAARDDEESTPSSCLPTDHCGAPDPYARRLPADNLRDYHDVTADADLSLEIRLIRVVLAHLAGDVDENHASMARALQTLLRAVYLQANQRSGQSDMERVLDEAAADVVEPHLHQLPLRPYDGMEG